jgi:ATP-binding cassette subfamily C protein
MLVEANRRNSETIIAMGMVEALGRRWTSVNDRYLAAVQRSSDVTSGYGSASKILRLVLQSAILGIGAYLVIQEQMTAGAMIAASIMMARALAPIETVIANWRGFVSARQSIGRLSEILNRAGTPQARTGLPPPSQRLEVSNLAVAGPGMERAIVSGVNFTVNAGEAIGVIGPSGGGKTSMGRVLVGVWPPARGSVRLDGAALDQWTSEDRGRYIGYVSQAIELFDGTVAENHRPHGPERRFSCIVRAAQAPARTR